MEDVLNNATTESVKHISRQLICGIKPTMYLKTILYSCKVDNINIVLTNYKPDYTDYTEIKIKIRNKKDFRDFIDTYGNSVVSGWTISNGCGRAWMFFSLRNLVKE